MSRFARVLAVLIGLVGVGIVVAAGTRTWALVSVPDLPGMTNVPLTGRKAAPSVIPVALAAGAGVIVLVTAGRVVRFLVGLGLVAIGAAVAVVSYDSRQDAADSLAKAVKTAIGVFGTTVGTPGGFSEQMAKYATADLSIWSLVSMVGGVLIAASGLLGVLTGHAWPGPSQRYEPVGVGVDGTPAAAAQGRIEGADEVRAWDALSRGDDPT